MPRYKVIDAPTYIDSNMRQIGEVVEYAGWPGSTLEPADGDTTARRIKDAYAAATKRGGRNRLPRLPDLATFGDPELEAKPALPVRVAAPAPAPEPPPAPAPQPAPPTLTRPRATRGRRNT